MILLVQREKGKNIYKFLKIILQKFKTNKYLRDENGHRIKQAIEQE